MSKSYLLTVLSAFVSYTELIATDCQIRIKQRKPFENRYRFYKKMPLSSKLDNHNRRGPIM